MRSKEFFISEAEQSLNLLENCYVNRDIRLKDVLSDIRLLLYGYSPDFPLLKDADSLFDKLDQDEMRLKCIIDIGGSEKIEVVEDMIVIVKKFISFLNKL